MNEVLSITVYANIEHSMRAQKCAATCTKMCRNGGKKHNIINLYPIFEILRKRKGYATMT